MSADIFIHPTALAESKEIGPGTRVWAFAHVLKGAVVGRNCNIGDHCFIEGGALIGNDVVIKNGVSVWSGVTLEDRAFVGPNAAFTNDRVPRAKDFHDEYERTLIRRGASLGANVTLVSPITVGCFAIVGAGAVVTHDVPDFGLVYGNPARLVGFVCQCGQRLRFAANDEGSATCVCSRSYEKRAGTVRQAVEKSESGMHA